MLEPDDKLLGERNFLRSTAVGLSNWINQRDRHQILVWMVVTILGCACFGAAIGWWRAPLQALYTAIKFPLLILLTTVGNALLNGILAPLMGVRLGIRDSLLSVLLSYAIAGAILFAFVPLLLFIVWNVPEYGMNRHTSLLTYSFIQLTTVVMIAIAGVIANIRLLRYLELKAETPLAAKRLLFAWLAGNLFLGSQICWFLRPFIGHPLVPVMFFGPDPFQGSFYETCFEALRALLTQNSGALE